MRSIGIDIGSSSIKVVEVLTTSKGFQVTQCFERPLGLNAAHDQEIEIIEFLREVSAKYDPAQTRYCLALRQDQVSIRNKIFPFNDRMKISKSLAFELEEDIPFSGDNSIFDAKVVRTLGNAAEVLACAAPKHHVRTLLQRCSDAGIDPALISTEGTAFANIYEKWNEPPPAHPPLDSSLLEGEARTERNVHLTLNMGHTRTLVCAFEGNSLIGVRTILWGAKNIADSVAKKYEIPHLEALKEIQTKAFILTNKQGATFDQITFSETIAKSVRELVRDLQLSILEFRSEFNAIITQVGLTGGSSSIKNLGPFLTQQLEVPVNKVYPLDMIPNVLFEKNAKTDTTFGLALGIAIEGLKKPRNPAVNFLKGDFAKQNNFVRNLWDKWGPTMKTAAAALVVFFIYSMMRETFSMELADRAEDALKTQAKNVAKLSGNKATEANIKKYIRENKKRAADLKTLGNVATMNSTMEILKKINDATPAKNMVTLDVKALHVQDNQVTIDGYVNNQNEVSVLQQALGNLSLDGKVSSRGSQLKPVSGKAAFSFNFKVDRGITKTVQ
ncbi:pilus assembly protein PilM [Bdellovibrio sp. HCB337]|uniref:pilus assembly protein PilM n=1 Tax=Bdellovibrio sp. HCB337 TaxID=3394358 RepID=UPI0039A52DCE